MWIHHSNIVVFWNEKASSVASVPMLMLLFSCVIFNYNELSPFNFSHRMSSAAVELANFQKPDHSWIIYEMNGWEEQWFRSFNRAVAYQSAIWKFHHSTERHRKGMWTSELCLLNIQPVWLLNKWTTAEVMSTATADALFLSVNKRSQKLTYLLVNESVANGLHASLLLL